MYLFLPRFYLQLSLSLSQSFSLSLSLLVCHDHLSKFLTSLPTFKFLIQTTFPPPLPFSSFKRLFFSLSPFSLSLSLSLSFFLSYFILFYFFFWKPACFSEMYLTTTKTMMMMMMMSLLLLLLLLLDRWVDDT